MGKRLQDKALKGEPEALKGRLKGVKIYASNILQNPPYCTNLQIPTNSGGMPQDPLTWAPHSLNVKY